MTGVRVIALVVLVALAGCAGGVSPPTGSPDHPSLPPGVTHWGVNSTALLDAHVDSVSNQSFTYTYTFEASSPGNTTHLVFKVNASHERAAVRSEENGHTKGTFITSDVWYNFDEHRGNRSYEVVNMSESPSPIFAPMLQPSRMRPLLSSGEWTTDGMTDCEAGTCWVLDATGVNESGQFSDAESYDGRAVVAPSGRVENISVTLERPNDTGTVTITVSDVGATTVTRPDWVSEANRSGTRVGFE